MTSKLPWMKFYGEWFYEDERTSELPLEAQALLMRALWLQWRDGSIPLNLDELRDQLDPRRETGERFKGLWSMLQPLFHLNDVRLVEPLHAERRRSAVQRRASKRLQPSHEARELWETLWREFAGEEWIWTKAQQHALRECVAMAEGDLLKLEQRARAMFGRHDLWTLENATPRLLSSRWNQLAYAVPKRNASQRNLEILRNSARELGLLRDEPSATHSEPKAEPMPNELADRFASAESLTAFEKLMQRGNTNHRAAQELDQLHGGRDKWPTAYREQYERAQAKLADELAAFEALHGSEPFRTVPNLNSPNP